MPGSSQPGLALLGPGLRTKGLNQRQRVGTQARTRLRDVERQELEPSLAAGGTTVVLSPNSPLCKHTQALGEEVS